jgi:hypothetical protein
LLLTFLHGAFTINSIFHVSFLAVAIVLTP